MKTTFLKMVMAGLLCLFLALPGSAWAVDKINLNTATAEQLTELPGIGPAIAAKIVAYREGHPFATIEELKDVNGIGQAKYDAIKDLVTVDKPAAKKE